VSFIIQLMSLSSGISLTSGLGQSPSVICKDSNVSPYSTVVILGGHYVTRKPCNKDASTFKLIPIKIMQGSTSRIGPSH